MEASATRSPHVRVRVPVRPSMDHHLPNRPFRRSCMYTRPFLPSRSTEPRKVLVPVVMGSSQRTGHAHELATTTALAIAIASTRSTPLPHARAPAVRGSQDAERRLISSLARPFPPLPDSLPVDSWCPFISCFLCGTTMTSSSASVPATCSRAPLERDAALPQGPIASVLLTHNSSRSSDDTSGTTYSGPARAVKLEAFGRVGASS